MLKPEKQYATKEDIELLMSMIQATMPYTPSQTSVTESSGSGNLFTEVVHKEHVEQPPGHLK